MRPAAWRHADDVSGRTTATSQACASQTYQYARRVKIENADLERVFDRVPLHEALFDFVLRVSALKKKTFVWEHSEKTAIAHEERVVSS